MESSLGQVLLPPNQTVLSAKDKKCFEHNAKKRARFRAENRSKIPQDDWLCYWNADMAVPFDVLLPSLRTHAHWLLHGDKPKLTPKLSARPGASRRRGARADKSGLVSKK